MEKQKPMGLRTQILIGILFLVMFVYILFIYISVAEQGTSIADMVLLIINIIYEPWDLIFSVVFFYCDSFLRTLSISIILILSLGRIFTILKTNFWKAMKYFLYIWYVGYCFYSFGIFTNIFSLNPLDWTTFMFSVLAPISLFIVGKQAQNVKVKGKKIFIYYILMFLYLLISIIWWYYYPEQVNFTVLAIYWVITLFTVSMISYII